MILHTEAHSGHAFKHPQNPSVYSLDTTDTKKPHGCCLFQVVEVEYHSLGELATIPLRIESWHCYSKTPGKGEL